MNLVLFHQGLESEDDSDTPTLPRSPVYTPPTTDSASLLSPAHEEPISRDDGSGSTSEVCVRWKNMMTGLSAGLAWRVHSDPAPSVCVCVYVFTGGRRLCPHRRGHRTNPRGEGRKKENKPLLLMVLNVVLSDWSGGAEGGASVSL